MRLSAVDSNRIVKRLIQNTFPQTQKSRIVSSNLLSQSGNQIICMLFQNLEI